MIEATELKAAAIIDRCQYELSGYVLTHPSRNAKVIVYAGATRWFPDPADFARVMEWMDSTGPSTPEVGFELDRSPAPIACTDRRDHRARATGAHRAPINQAAGNNRSRAWSARSRTRLCVE